MRKTVIAVVCFLLVLLSTSCNCPAIQSNEAYDLSSSLLFVTEKEEQAAEMEYADNSIGAVFETVPEYHDADLSAYNSIAVPYDEAAQYPDFVRKAYESGVRIYLYGDGFTLSDYETVIGIPEFGTNVSVNSNTGGEERKEMFQGFTYDQKKKPIHVAAMSKDDTYSKAYFAIFQGTSKDVITPDYYLTAVVDDLNMCQMTARSPQRVKSSSNTSVYYLGTSSRTAMNYELWKDMNDIDPNADYYGIVQNVFASTDKSGAYISETDSRYSLLYGGDTVYDFYPSNMSGVNSYHFNFGLSEDGSPINISTTFGGRVSIDVFPNMGSGEFQWAFMPSGLGTHHLDNEVLKTGTTWAARNGEAAVNLSMRSTTRWDLGYQMSDWETIGVTYR